MLPALALAPVLAAATVAAGHVEPLQLHDSHAARDRRLWVYTPPGYDAAGPAADLIVVLDGEQYLQMGLPALLDALLAEKKAPPFVAIFVDNGTGAARLADLANRAPFAAFVGEELIPWARKRWNVTRDPHGALVLGSSAGGLAAAYLAFQRPDLFGNVLSQSGAFWRGDDASNDPPYEWLTGRYASSPAKDLRFVLDVGALEDHRVLGGTGPNMRDANRRFRDALQARGYRVHYTEVPGGAHSPEHWARRLREDLTQVVQQWARPPRD